MTQILPFAYAAAGIVVPAFYVSQVKTCLRDQSGLAAFSLTKCVVQLFLRAAMLPFVLMVGHPLVVAMTALDFVGRFVETVAAVAALRRQGWTWTMIGVRSCPMLLWRLGRRRTATGSLSDRA